MQDSGTSFGETFANLVGTLNGFVWSTALISLALGAGVFYTIMTRAVQIRMFREMWRLLFSSKESEHGISSFQALAVSLSGRVGTGNIAGVAAAIGFGGPGAVSLPGQGIQFVVWFDAPLAACITIAGDADGRVEVDGEGSFVAVPLGEVPSTTCDPEMRSVLLNCPDGCRAVWRLDQLEEIIR